jgi:hypothetical protein
MKSCEVVSLVTALACGIANSVPAKEVPLIAAILGEIGATLATITVNEELNNPKEEKTIPEIPPVDTEILDELPPATR